MRTSEIIMVNSSVRSTSKACSPDETGDVSKPWPVRKEFSKLRCPASSSTIRMRGAFGLRGADGICPTLYSLELGCHLLTVACPGCTLKVSPLPFPHLVAHFVDPVIPDDLQIDKVG